MSDVGTLDPELSLKRAKADIYDESPIRACAAEDPNASCVGTPTNADVLTWTK
ncbi:MAG TPA: hypothetical protein VK805_12965 [Candidatus Baltobacteraceae bacterium]|nr:hypothetical protein [Candidatus Baltobacteraceae bacterium]